MKSLKAKLVLLAAVSVLIVSFFYFDLGQYLTLDYLKSQQAAFEGFYQENTALTIFLYLAIYIIATAASFPGATVLTLAGGAIFGLALGTALVSVASTVGATIAFLLARFLMRDFVERKFGDKLKTINDGIEKDSDFFLFSLRLVPIVPFFVINLSMGLTSIKTWKFFVVSQVGMLFGTAVYVNAGTQLSQISSLADVMSPGLLGSFVLLGITPIVSKKVLEYVKNVKARNKTQQQVKTVA